MSENIASIESTYTVPEVADLFGIALGKVHRMVEERHLAYVRIDGVKRIPKEFIQGADPLPSLRGTLIALSDVGLSDDRAVEWLFEENEELGIRPIDSLLKGHKAAVRRATQSLAF